MGTDGKPRQRRQRDVDVSDQQWGSDFLVDLLGAYGFEYASFNPGASFRGIEESLRNYSDGVPEVIQVQNEAISVAIAHGYAKATGEPALCLLHDTVGTLNGSMGVYNAYVDRVPVVMLGGNGPLRKSERRPWIDWIHSHQDQASLVRDFVKWDDEPAHVDGLAESLLRGIRISNTRPKGPVYLTIGHDLQENELDEPIPVPDLSDFEPPTRMATDPDALERAAETLADADLPVILVDQVGDSRRAVDALVDLAETLGAPVVDSYGHLPHRYNFPNTHPMDLTGTDAVSEADIVLALDVWSVPMKTSTVDRGTHEVTSLLADDITLIDIGTDDLEASSLTYDYSEFPRADQSILADTHLAVPALRDAVADALADDRRARERAESRYDRWGERHREQRETWRQQAEDAGDDSPIAPSYLALELGDVIAGDEWVVVAGTLAGWPHRLWDIDGFDKYIGGMSGGGGVGYQLGAAVGGALAYEDSGRVPINLQSDGALLQFLGGLWTVEHHDVPLFTVVHNNGCLYNSTRHRMELAAVRGRDDSFESALVGTSTRDPRPDYGAIAETFDIEGFGPVTDPGDLRETLADAWEVAKRGNPVLVDVHCQSR